MFRVEKECMHEKETEEGKCLFNKKVIYFSFMHNLRHELCKFMERNCNFHVATLLNVASAVRCHCLI